MAKIAKQPVLCTVLAFEETERRTRLGLVSARLDCGHDTLLTRFEGQVWYVRSGRFVPKKRSDFKGHVVAVGDEVRCHECTREAYRVLLAARPAEKAERYDSQEAVLTAHPGARWEEYGPVHRHGDALYVQVYLGQHEWLAFCVEDAREVWSDPGWEGTLHGWAYLPRENAAYATELGTRGEICPPERPGKPITGDELLQADLEKLRAYLGPDDPLRAALDGGKKT